MSSLYSVSLGGGYSSALNRAVNSATQKVQHFTPSIMNRYIYDIMLISVTKPLLNFLFHFCHRELPLQ